MNTAFDDCFGAGDKRRIAQLFLYDLEAFYLDLFRQDRFQLYLHNISDSFLKNSINSIHIQMVPERISQQVILLFLKYSIV